MFKTISTSQVTLGMHIYELKGAWVDHPFWKTKFVLKSQADLDKLRASAVKEVVIDIEKGLDVAPASTVVPAPILAPKAPDVEVKKAESSALPKRVTAQEERKAATRAIIASKKAVTDMFHDVRMGKAISAEAALPLVEEIASSVTRNEGALISLVRLKTKDDYTYMHSVAVCALMIALAKQLELSEAEIKQAGLAGLLHDLGKAAIPPEILNKPGALTDDEFSEIKLHPERGLALLQEGNVTDPVTLDVVLHHHEKIDGSGYPKGLKLEQISIFAKMGAVCDVYDAVTSNRAYKPGWEPGLSIQRMAQWTNHFDQTVFKAFVKSIGIYPIGSMVKLKSERLAVVIDQSPNSLLTPIVKVFFSIKQKTRVPIEVLDLSKASVNDAIIGHEDPTKWEIKDLNSIWSQ